MNSQHTIQDKDLPLWMQQARRDIDWGILIALVMSIAVAWMFILRTELAGGNQLEHIVFQASDMVEAIEEGRLLPRWSPHTLNGYGAPIADFYPIGTPYTIAVINILFTNDLSTALRIVIIASFAIAGMTVYLFVSRRVNAASGLIASLLYIYSPMISMTIPHVLGDISLLMASALLPLYLWAIFRLMTVYGIADFATTALSLAMLIFTYPQMALLAIIIGILYILLDRFDLRLSWRLFRLIIVLCFALGISSLFWLPALNNHHLVQWHQALIPAKPYRLTLESLFAPMRQIDIGSLLPEPQFALGIILIFSILIGSLLLVITQQVERRFHTLFIILGLILGIIAIGYFSAEVWLLVPITLCFSVGGSSILLIQFWLPQLYRVLLAFLVAIILIFALPIWLMPPSNIIIDASQPGNQLRFQQLQYGISNLADGMPIPSNIQPNPSVNRVLASSYETSQIRRYDVTQNTAQTTVSLLESLSHSQRYRIHNEISRNLEFIVAYYEGWQAYLDGEPLATTANPQTGLIQVRVPVVDDGELLLILDSSAIHRQSQLICGLSFSLLLLLVIIRTRRRRSDIYEPLIMMSRPDGRMILLVFFILAVILIFLTSENPPVRLRNPAGFSIANYQSLQTRSNVGIEALAFHVDKQIVTRGDSLNVSLFWQTLITLPDNYRSVISLRQRDNRLSWYYSDFQIPGNIPARRWKRNTFVRDDYTIPIASDIPAGPYQIVIEIFRCEENCQRQDRIIFFDLNGNLLGEELTLPMIVEVR